MRPKGPAVRSPGREAGEIEVYMRRALKARHLSQSDRVSAAPSALGILLLTVPRPHGRGYALPALWASLILRAVGRDSGFWSPGAFFRIETFYLQIHPNV
jgi:hypothetical protein